MNSRLAAFGFPAALAVVGSLAVLSCQERASPVRGLTAKEARPLALVTSRADNATDPEMKPRTAAEALAMEFGATPAFTSTVTWDSNEDASAVNGIDTQPLLLWNVHGSTEKIEFMSTAGSLEALRLGDNTRLAFGCSCNAMAHGPKDGSEYRAPARWSSSDALNVVERVSFSGRLRGLCGFSTAGYCQPREVARIKIEVEQKRAPVEAFLYGTIADRADVVPICVLADPSVLDESLSAAVAAPAPTPAGPEEAMTRWLAYMHWRTERNSRASGAAQAPIEMCALSPSCRRTDAASLDSPGTRASREVPLANGLADLDKECDFLSAEGRTFLEKKDLAFAATTTACLVVEKYERSVRGAWKVSARSIRGGLLRSMNHVGNTAAMHRLWITGRSGDGGPSWKVESWSTEAVRTEGVPPGLPSSEELRAQQKDLGLGLNPYYVWVPRADAAATLMISSTDVISQGPPGSPFSVKPRLSPVTLLQR